MIEAVFNRLRYEEAENNEPYIIEFNEQIKFTINDGIMMCEKYNVVFNEFITPPQRFYEAVKKEFLKLYKEDKLFDVTVYTRCEWDEHIKDADLSEDFK